MITKTGNIIKISFYHDRPLSSKSAKKLSIMVKTRRGSRWPFSGSRWPSPSLAASSPASSSTSPFSQGTSNHSHYHHHHWLTPHYLQDGILSIIYHVHQNHFNDYHTHSSSPRPSPARCMTENFTTTSNSSMGLTSPNHTPRWDLTYEKKFYKQKCSNSK